MEENKNEEILDDIEARRKSFLKIADILQETISPQEEGLLEKLCDSLSDICSQYEFLLTLSSEPQIPLSESFEFSEWCSKNNYCYLEIRNCWIIRKRLSVDTTTEELYKLFKEQT